jgi:hypothetical protein
MPKVKANNLTVNYDQQGGGDALVLILIWRRTG